MSPTRETLPSCFVLTVANQKGGVGKTTTTMNLGVALARLGKRVLLIDSDPQANLTSYLGVTPGQEPHASIRTLDEIYLSKRVMDEETLSEFLTKTESGVDLLAAEATLTGVDYYLLQRADRERVLDGFLASVRRRYDFILIDTPPALSLLTINALVASNGVLVPVQTEFFSLEGIVKIRKAIADARERWNPRLELVGVLPTQVSSRRNLTQEVLDALATELGPKLFSARIHESASIAESSGHARSVLDYDRSSKGAKDYIQAAEELVARCSNPSAYLTHENPAETLP